MNTKIKIAALIGITFIHIGLTVVLQFPIWWFVLIVVADCVSRTDLCLLF